MTLNRPQPFVQTTHGAAAVQERSLRCVQYPKQSTTAAEIEAVHQEIEKLQAETEQAVQQYEVSFSIHLWPLLLC